MLIKIRFAFSSIHLEGDLYRRGGYNRMYLFVFINVRDLYKRQLTVYVFISIAVDSYAVEDIILTWLNPDALQIDGKLQIPQYTLVAWQQKHDLNKYSTGNYSNQKGNEASFYFFHFFKILLCPVSYYGYVTQLFDLLCNRGNLNIANCKIVLCILPAFGKFYE